MIEQMKRVWGSMDAQRHEKSNNKTETRQADDALRYHLDLYQMLAANIPNGAAFLIDTDLRYLLAEGQGLQQTGYTSQDFIGKTIWEALDPEMASRYEPYYRQALNGQPFDTEHHGYGHDYLIRGAPVRDEQGRVMAILILSYDITERKQAERALQESQLRLRIATEAARLGIYDYDILQDRIHWDARVRDIWGVAPDLPITYQVFLSGVHPEDRLSTQAALDRALDPSGDGKFDAVYRVIHQSSGIERWVAAAGLVIFQQGKAARLIGAVEDITDRKQAEQDLQESQERFRSILENSLDVAYRRNLRLDCYDYMSPVVEQVLGYTVDEMKSMPAAQIMEAVHPDDRDQVQSQLDEALVSGAGQLVYRFQTRSGDYCWLADNVTITRDAAGHPVFRTGILRDISAAKSAENELSLTVERLQAMIASPLIGIVIGDASGKLYQVNDYYLNLLGYTREEFERGMMQWDAMTPPEYLPRDYKAIQELEERGVCTPVREGIPAQRWLPGVGVD